MEFPSWTADRLPLRCPAVLYGGPATNRGARVRGQLAIPAHFLLAQIVVVFVESNGTKIASALPFRWLPVFATSPITFVRALGSSILLSMMPFAPTSAALSRIDEIMSPSSDQLDSPLALSTATSR